MTARLCRSTVTRGTRFTVAQRSQTLCGIVIQDLLPSHKGRHANVVPPIARLWPLAPTPRRLRTRKSEERASKLSPETRRNSAPHRSVPRDSGVAGCPPGVGGPSASAGGRMHTTGHRTGTAITCTGKDQLALELGKPTQDRQHQSTVRSKTTITGTPSHRPCGQRQPSPALRLNLVSCKADCRSVFCYGFRSVIGSRSVRRWWQVPARKRRYSFSQSIPRCAAIIRYLSLVRLTSLAYFAFLGSSAGVRPFFFASANIRSCRSRLSTIAR